MAKTDTVKTASSEVAVPVNDDGDIQAFINKEAQGLDANYVPESWDDIVAQFDGEIITFEGSPWRVVKKDKLVDVPFMIADVRHYNGTYGDAVAVMLITKDPVKYGDSEDTDTRFVINDGSTGVYAQVTAMVRRTGRKAGLLCPKGLRSSSYEFQETDLDGEPMIDPKTGKPKPPIPATTYYVA